MKRGHPESNIQQAIVDYLRARGHFPVAVPNGTKLAGTKKQRQMRAAILKKEGMMPGFPDLIVYGSGGRIGHIEVKAERGYQQKTQKACEARLNELGHQYAICRSIDDVSETLSCWGWK